MLYPTTTALLIGALLDLLLGDPRWLPHPIRGIGLLIHHLERLLRKLPNEKFAGCLLVILVLASVVTVVSTTLFYGGLPVAAFWIFTCLAARTLDRDSNQVIAALRESDLTRARSLVANLVGRDTIPDLWRRHILDSAQLHRFVPGSAESLIDLGSGAGLPGLVLAILGVPGVELVEADSRKAAFLREAARITAAAVTIRPCRIQAVPPHLVRVVTARACAPLSKLLSYAQHFAGPQTTCLFPKGQNVGHELTQARKFWKMKVQQHPSLTDPSGVVLEIRELANARGHASARHGRRQPEGRRRQDHDGD